MQAEAALIITLDVAGAVGLAFLREHSNEYERILLGISIAGFLLSAVIGFIPLALRGMAPS